MATSPLLEPDSSISTAIQRGTRDYYIDRLRSVMTALVLFHHTAITYGGSGGWFWSERTPSADPSSLLLTLFLATNQAYFMGFFFLLAGYFTPASLEKKGYANFLRDRLLRLGIPLLAFIVILGPLTAAIVTWFEGKGFWPTIQSLWNRQRIINGPLWFAEALLIFALGYMAWRAAFGSSLTNAERIPTSVPSKWTWLLSAIGVGAASIAVRQFVPTGVNVFGLQLGYFPTYIFLFAVGILAWRHDWIRQLSWQQAGSQLRYAIGAMILAWPCMPIAIAFARAHAATQKTNFSGGLSWTAILYAMWEPFVAWGAICLWLLFFRKHMNQPSPIWEWLNRRAYAVYILHPVVLVTVALLFHPWGAPPLIKFAVTGTLTCLATWLVSDPFVRLPGLRRIL